MPRFICNFCGKERISHCYRVLRDEGWYFYGRLVFCDDCYKEFLNKKKGLKNTKNLEFRKED